LHRNSVITKIVVGNPVVEQYNNISRWSFSLFRLVPIASWMGNLNKIKINGTTTITPEAPVKPVTIPEKHPTRRIRKTAIQLN